MFYVPFSICRRIDRICQRWSAESDEIRRLRVVDRTITWSIAGLGGSEYTDLLLMGQNTYTIHLSTRSSTSSSSPRSISYQVKRSVLCRPGHTVRDMPSPPIRRGKWNPPCVTAGCSEIKALNKERLHHQPSAEPHKPLTASHTRVIKHMKRMHSVCVCIRIYTVWQTLFKCVLWSHWLCWSTNQRAVLFKLIFLGLCCICRGLYIQSYVTLSVKTQLKSFF